MYKCKQCTKSFKGSVNLKIHLRTHSGEKTFQCKLCTKSFGQCGDLKKHVRRYTGENLINANIVQPFFQMVDI